MKNDRKVISAREQVDFPDYGMSAVMAKIDTGAYTGALHCTKIEMAENGTLSFSPFDHPEIAISTSEYVRRQVKSSNGKSQKRYFISTTITIQGEKYKIELSLADRSEMKHSVLIGRKFLRQNHFLVDVNRQNGIVTQLR